MKLVTFEVLDAISNSIDRNGKAGLVVDNHIIDLQLAFAFGEEKIGRRPTEASVAERYGVGILGLIESSERSLPMAREIAERYRQGDFPSMYAGKKTVYRADEIRLLSPLPRPPSVRVG